MPPALLRHHATATLGAIYAFAAASRLAAIATDVRALLPAVAVRALARLNAPWKTPQQPAALALEPSESTLRLANP